MAHNTWLGLNSILIIATTNCIHGNHPSAYKYPCNFPPLLHLIYVDWRQYTLSYIRYGIRFHSPHHWACVPLCRIISRIMYVTKHVFKHTSSAAELCSPSTGPLVLGTSITQPNWGSSEVYLHSLWPRRRPLWKLSCLQPYVARLWVSKPTFVPLVIAIINVSYTTGLSVAVNKTIILRIRYIFTCASRNCQEYCDVITSVKPRSHRVCDHVTTYVILQNRTNRK